MELKPGLSALITGAASGIGKALSLAFAERGIFVTVVDYSEEKGKEVVALIEKQNAKFHKSLNFPSAIFIRCDVTQPGELSSAFAKHLATYGGLDICINNAGIISPIPLQEDRIDSSGGWRRTVNVNLIAVIECTLLADKTFILVPESVYCDASIRKIQAMQTSNRGGAIINLGSSSGLYPYYIDPIYSASKGAVVLFTRSLFTYKRQGIRVNVMCPEFVETDMGKTVDAKLVTAVGGFIPMEMIIKGALELITDDTKAGSCLWITKRRGLEYWPNPIEEAKYRIPSSKLRRSSMPTYSLGLKLPQSFEKIIVHTLNHNFRAATRIMRTPLGLPIKPNHVLVKILYAGVNASDVVYSAGRYFSGNNNDVAWNPPLDAGFEAVGIIAAVGDSVETLKIGTAAAVMTFGSYAEFVTVPSKFILPVAKPDPEVVAMLTCGLTASIALEKAAQMGSGQSVLVTAAAGGTGQFAVQLAKLAGNKVVATCGGDDKAMLLKKLGVDRVINYREDSEEDITTVLKKEFPKGIDIIFESVGGQMFDLSLNALAIYGRLLVIGMISQYQGENGWLPSNYPGLCDKLLAKSQTVAGFFLMQYSRLWQQHLDKLFTLYSSGNLKVNMDPRKFVGLQSVADAVEYLHSGKSIGKVVVCIDPAYSQVIAKL